MRIASLMLLAAWPLAAQTEYHELEAGRPVGIEDAFPTARQAIELQLAPVTVEQFGNGLTRATFEPAVTYGILPRTDIELFAPFIFRERGETPSHGITQFGIAGLYNFNNESRLLPAFALKGEIAFPAGGSPTSGTLYEGRAIATRTFGAFRLHLNVGYSSYHVAPAPPPPVGCTKNCPPPPPPTPDYPCGIVTDNPAPPATLDEAVANIAKATSASGAAASGQTNGNVLLLGGALDRSFPLMSLLVVGDLYVQQYSNGLPRPADWTSDVGFRKQISPRFVLDAGVGRLFRGLRPAWLVTLGTTYTFGIAALVPEARPGAY